MISKRLNLFSWNASGIMSSSSYLCNSLNKCSIDICGISEHWLSNSNIHFIDAIDNNYKSHVVTECNSSILNRNHISKGGVAILWHLKHDRFVTPLIIDDNRIVGIQFEVAPNQFVYILQVYLPCSNHPIEHYRNYIDKLFNLWSLYSENGTVIFMGDFNAKVNQLVKGNLRIDLVAANTLPICSGAASSFVSYDGKCEYLIDFFLLPVEKADCVTHCEIIEDNCLNVSTHRPIYSSICIPVEAIYNCSNFNLPNYHVNWRKVKPADVNLYQDTLNNSDFLLNFHNYPLSCTDAIDQAYDNIVSNIVSSSQKCFKSSKFKHFLKPYWNADLSKAHKCMSELRKAWIQCGQPRGHSFPSYTLYKNA